VYAHDVELPGMLVGKIKRSPHPHARIISSDLTAAARMPGVHAVVGAADLPPDRLYAHQGWPFSDRPPFARDKVRFLGQEIAAVAAEDEAMATAALAAIEVRYHVMRAPLTVDEALAPGGPQLHARPAGSNVSVDATTAWGDVAGELREAAHVASGTYEYPQVSHVSMEPHTTIAWWHDEDGRLEVWSSTQSPYHVRKELADVLDLPLEQIAFRPLAVGGGFGAKSKITDHEVAAALLSMRCGRPVKVALTREEDFATTKSRHAFRTSLTVALDAEGRLSAFDADLLVDNGAYNHSGPPVMLAGMGVFGLLYRPRAIRVRGRLVDTAKVPGGQFRGYGMPQTSLALESEVDELARASGIDPIDLRIRNANLPGEETISGAKVGTVGLVQCLQAARDAIGWDEKRRNPRPGRGLGVAVAIHGSGTYSWQGSNESSARVEIDGEGRVKVRFGGADPGTGQRTLLAQLAGEELGVDAEQVEVEMMDLSMDHPDQGAFSSRGTHFGGNATLAAARAAAGVLLDAAREKFGTPDVELAGGEARAGADAVALGELVSLVTAGTGGVLSCDALFQDPSVMPTTALGEHGGRGNVSPTYSFAAHIAEVDVDVRTGEVSVVDYVAAHDSGVVLNPAQAESQVVGGVAMGLGAALREQLSFDHGRMVNPAYLHYGVPRAADLPDVRVLFVGDPEPRGPLGAKSVAEVSIVPVGAAVANAVRDATGLRIRELPITPDKVVAAARAAGLVTGVAPASLTRRPDRWWIALMRWAYPRGVARALHRLGPRLARRRAVPPVSGVERPDSVEDLHALVAAGHTPMGGGTELHVLRRQGLSTASRLVTVGGVDELRAIEHAGDAVVVGSGVTLRALADDLGRTLPIVAEAVETIATPQVRALATVGGNLLQEKRC
jgi:CO/xanthine dehydrogenase Mo-binding subunit